MQLRPASLAAGLERRSHASTKDAVCFACLPSHAMCVSQIGTDANAPLLKEALTHSGVDLTHLKDVEGPTGTAIIILQKSGTASRLLQHLMRVACAFRE